MNASKFLAIDLGAESGRAIVGILENNFIHLEEVHRFPNKQINILGHLHWDVLALFDEIKTGIRMAVQKGHSDIQSIGIDTWGVDFGFVGKKNELLGFPYCYRDPRTNDMMERTFNKMPREEIYSITGIQFWQFNSIFQLAKYVEDNSDILKIADKLLFMPDLFNYLFTGIKKSEYTIATTSQLMNAYHKTWDKDLFKKLKLPIDIMPEIVRPGMVIGKILPQIAKETGIKEIEVIAPGCHDTASAVAAVPISGGNSAFISSGTWSIVGIENDTPLINEVTLKNNFTNEGGVGNKIRFMSNAMGMWLLQQIRKSWQKQNEDISYEEMTKLSLDARPFKCIINTDDNSFYNPPDMQKAISDYCLRYNMPVPENKSEYIRCILESLAFKYKCMLENINEMSGRKIERLHIVGGGSQNEVLNQLTADACGIPVVAGPVEATALGNILVQAISKGRIQSLDAARKIVADSFAVQTFMPAASEGWDNISCPL